MKSIGAFFRGHAKNTTHRVNVHVYICMADASPLKIEHRGIIMK